ncbi:hypothetical protein EV644_115120 [Kribbella orskensis]|uniref:Uncharacterized protein n=1 Tax=Kribbella orskensis TaxID=2512216 RepID=A0ABY2BDN5_9ACTN|nr:MULTISPECIES: hypothetical protein [Kribbella]TCN35556.1 hypothetical protein EV642_116120 [Kribbella sp. VKM Ac-2500]TCO17098.1 hypothetical protein EV644_115120 [Kribbella orskensis]
MTIHDELGQTRRALQNLEKALAGLRNQLGPHLDVLRLIDDVSRCSTDLRRLEEQVGPPRLHELMVIPDDDRDHGLWGAADVDHEGLGAPGRRGGV